jgi:glycerophosphoryl diester phosphodiesterase
MILLGHRGARATRSIPENTIASFELSLEHGCDGFEFDVRCSADGVAVICHDPTAHGHPIETTPAEKLGLATLDEVLQRFSSRAFLDIELKAAGLESATVAALRAYPPARGYVVSSFLPEVLRALHDLDSGIPLGFLSERKNQLPPPLPLAWIIPHYKLVDQDMIDEARAADAKTLTWTVNKTPDFRRLAALGIDAIISDETNLLVQTLR